MRNIWEEWTQKILVISLEYIFVLNRDSEDLYSIVRMIKISHLKGMSCVMKNKELTYLILHVKNNYDCLLDPTTSKDFEVFKAVKYCYWRITELNLPIFKIKVQKITKNLSWLD